MKELQEFIFSEIKVILMLKSELDISLKILEKISMEEIE